MERTIAKHGSRRRYAVQVSACERQQGGLSVATAAAVVVLAAITAWSYWPVMVDLLKHWRNSQDYSAGQLVPWVAVFLAWREREALRTLPLKPCWIGGLLLLLVAQAGRAFGLLFLFESAERYSLVLSIAALVLLVAGWRVFRHMGWILLFLFLMVPFPGRIHNMISGPLQTLATSGSVFLMEAFYNDVTRDGNVVTLGGHTLGVLEACSGLRMLTAFIIVAGFIAYMVKVPRWQKAVVLISSIPVAVICNIVRIFATGMLMLYVGEEFASKFFHDFAGLVMMPIAVSLMFAELWIMDKCVIPDEQPEPEQVVARREGAGRNGRKPARGRPNTSPRRA